MLKLAVCDDSQLFLDEIRKQLLKDERIKEVAVYEKPEELLRELTAGKREFDAIFMDIEFDREQNGIQYSREIFRKAPQIPIIYVTGYQDKYIQQVFLTDSNLIGYLTKPLDSVILEKYLDKILEKQTPKPVFTFSVRGKACAIAADHIWYLESDNHRVQIHTEEDSYTVYEKLSNLHKRLPASFIQCHKSFLVNLNRIRYMEGKDIFFPDGRQVPISKIHQEGVRKSYFLHLGQSL